MQISEARQFLGRQCAVTYNDKSGVPVTRNLRIHDIAFVPLYGTYLIGDVEDVCLDRVTEITTLE